MAISPNVILDRKFPGVSERALTAFVAKAAQAVRLRGAPTVLLTNNRHMSKLNAQFRGKNYATDVLSFPAANSIRGFAGDIAISLDIASANARALGHTPADEVKVLILHGILHLAGYDHEEDNGQMAVKEARLRRKLGLPLALTERVLAKPRRARPARLPI